VKSRVSEGSNEAGDEQAQWVAMGGWLTTNEDGANGVAVRVHPHRYRLRDVRQKNRPVPTVSESVSIRPRDVRCAVLLVLLRCDARQLGLRGVAV